MDGGAGRRLGRRTGNTGLAGHIADSVDDARIATEGAARLDKQSTVDILIVDIADVEPSNTVSRSDPKDLLPLTPAVFHVLLALAGGDAHGYGVMQQVAALTNGQTTLGPGTLYRSIQKMLIDGLIEEVGGPQAEVDERRRVYRLTRFGRQVARAEAQRLGTLVAAAIDRKLILQPGENSP